MIHHGKLMVGEGMAPVPTGNLQLNANSPPAGGHFGVSGYHRLKVFPYNMVDGSCVVTVTLLRYYIAEYHEGVLQCLWVFRNNRNWQN